MKKFIFISLFFLMAAGPMKAQDVYNLILKEAKAVANNPDSNPLLAKIAFFKVNTLQYIHDKAVTGEGEVTTRFLDNQAYYMSQFVNSFLKDVLANTALSKAEKRKKVMLYIDASGSNPLYKDEDREVTDAYVNDSKNQITPFSLNTDWPKAYAAVMSQKK